LPLIVVPVAASDAASLTLEEWDALRACSRVFFEVPDHPLMKRLAGEGVACGAFDDEPQSTDEGCALVADPSSGRVVDLARAGALVTAGPARAPDSLSAAHAAPVVRDVARSLVSVAVVMARLRSVDGCPWDQKQTHKSLEAHLLEESHEVIDAIECGETGAGLQEELGDLLLQVAFHARIAQQEGRFDLGDVGNALVAKLIRRHPHVFGDTVVADADEVLQNWESIKRTEKTSGTGLEDIPRSLPALLAAYKTQKRAAAHGFAPTRDEAERELRSALGSDDVGASLFWLVAIARSIGVDPETALLSATARFRADLRRDAS
jgi:XTP/dITP diphosphohydrolase